jgi:hypothetical protein
VLVGYVGSAYSGLQKYGPSSVFSLSCVCVCVCASSLTLPTKSVIMDATRDSQVLGGTRTCIYISYKLHIFAMTQDVW